MITRDLSKVTHLACDRAGNRLTRDYLVAYFVGMELQTRQDGSSSSLPTLCYHRITEDNVWTAERFAVLTALEMLTPMKGTVLCFSLSIH